MKVSVRRLLRSACVSGVALILVLWLIVLTAKAANYTSFAFGTVSWTATTGVWGCATTGPTDSCGSFPGQITFTNGIVDNANVPTTSGGTLIKVDSPIANPVTLNVSAGSVTVDVSSGGSLTLTGASAVSSTISPLPTLSISGGTLSNAGALTIGGSGSSFNLNNGTLSGTGTMTINSGNFLNITATGGPTAINQQTINNSGSASFNSAGTTTMGSGAAFNNMTGASFTGGSGATIAAGASPILFSNAANLQNPAAGTSFTMGVPFSNTSIAALSTSGAAFDNFTGGSGPSGHSNATWNLGTGGTMNFGGTHVFNNGQTFIGSGTVNINSGGVWTVSTTPATISLPAGINLTNNGTIGLGSAPTIHTLSVGGAFTQSGTGTLQPKLGPTNGTSDAVNVTGPATLAGTLAPFFNAGYTPANGDTFTVMTYGSHVGSFIYTPIPYANGNFQISYTPTMVQLVATPFADISVAKSGPPSVLDGQNATFTVTVGNLGPSAATGVTITDTFTGGTFVSAIPTGGGSCSGTGPATCSWPSIANGASVSVSVVLKAAGVGTLMNTATRTASTPADPNSGNDSASFSTTVNPAADLAITSVSGSPNPVNAAATETWTVNAVNNGPDAASSVTINMSLSGGTILAPPTSSNPAFTCTNLATTAQCTAASLASLGSTTITVSSKAQNQGGTMTLNANVSSTTADPVAANNTGTGSVTITAVADLAISKMLSGLLVAGQNATYTITVNNAGPSDAANVMVSDPTPAGLTFVSNSGACSTPFPCSLGTLTSGQTVTITTTYSVPSSATGTVTNTASVSSTTNDPNSANNSSTSSNAILTNADLAISKVLSGFLVAGQNATYTITVNNGGPSDAVNVMVSDPTPAGLTFVSNTGACSTPFPCSLGTLTSGQTVTITTTYSVPSSATGSVTNTASVSSTTNDPNSANNSSTSSNAILTKADVAISKTLVGSLIAGQNATYTITVNNGGPSDAVNVMVSDPTPAGLTFVSNSGACSTPFPCSLGTLTSGQTVTITTTYSVPSNATGTISNVATVSSTTPDPNVANNSSTASNAVMTKADLAVTKTGPSTAFPGSNVTYTITVMNNGPSDAASVMLTDPTPSRLSFVSATGACSSFPCALGNMTSGQTKSVQATYTVLPGPTTTIVNTATASSPTPDPNTGNNSGSASTSTGCPTGAPGNTAPANGLTNVPTSGTLSWSDVGAASYTVYLDVQGGSCSKFFGSTTATSLPYAGLQQGTTYQWRVVASSPGCIDKSTACMTFTTFSSCPLTPPTLISPLNTTVTGAVTFSWSAVAGAINYKLFVNGTQIFSGNATSFGPVAVGSGPVTWYVIAEFAPPCTSLQSVTGNFNGCDTTVTTTPSLVAQADSGQGYDLAWQAVSGATRYEVDEATDQNFATATTQSTTATTMHFQHPVNVPTAFYYRVRAFLTCANGFAANSATVRIVLSPVTLLTNPNVSAPAGSKTLVPIVVHFDGFEGATFPFTTDSDHKPWIDHVEPASGVLTAPDGVNVTVFVNPGGLPNGTFTATVYLLLNTSAKGSITNNGVTTVAAPVSVSLTTPITPVIPKPGDAPPPGALIFPSVGHLDGINSKWVSNVHVANTSSQKVQYQLTFTPDDLTKGVKRTIIDVDAGATTTLDDIVKTWYGVGSLGETANGVIEIRPLTSAGKGPPSADAVDIALATVASSATYNIAANGTLGEFVTPIRFSSFIGRAVDSSQAATILGLQHIAQSDAFRSNIGVMEASGQPASVLISVFNSSGSKLLDFPLTLQAYQQQQLNSFLAQNKISFDDGRIEVKVTGGEGKITAYGSVIDQRSGDPFLVTGVPLGQNAFDHFVLPGVADLKNAVAAWRSDMDIFNPTPTPQFVTLTFYSQNSSAAPQTTSMTLNAGEVKHFDNTLATLFGASNTGGAIHVTTTTPVPLVINGRTYNLTDQGTLGQLINGVTSADAVGKGDRALQVLQAEDSVRYRTNLGIAEVTGKPAMVEVTAFLPDSKIAPSTQIPLQANGFIQVPVLQSLGLTNVYNARVSLRVVDGDGKISAYGSVIDQRKQTPIYIPGQ